MAFSPADAALEAQEATEDRYIYLPGTLDGEKIIYATLEQRVELLAESGKRKAESGKRKAESGKHDFGSAKT